MEHTQIFKELAQDLYNNSDKTHSYEYVVLQLLKTRYALLLPEEMDSTVIAYILDCRYERVNDILKKLLGYTPTSGSKVTKSLLRKLAHVIQLKENIPVQEHSPDIEYGTKI